jgi:thiol-disulfide isomerase/thioredoxin
MSDSLAEMKIRAQYRHFNFPYLYDGATQLAGANELKKLRANQTGKFVLVNFWATSCDACVHEFPELVDTFRMYRGRDFEFVAVSTNMPDEKSSVMKMLQKQHASNRNLLFASNDISALQKAFDLKWESNVPFTVLLSPQGEVLYRKEGALDVRDLRRHILASIPADNAGFQKYWTAP